LFCICVYCDSFRYFDQALSVLGKRMRSKIRKVNTILVYNTLLCRPKVSAKIFVVKIQWLLLYLFSLNIHTSKQITNTFFYSMRYFDCFYLLTLKYSPLGQVCQTWVFTRT
jgi:hypothetical protein